ncbi:MAG: hypothetical protein QXH67_04565 [Candidatus Bathyarchaeia archaeon]
MSGVAAYPEASHEMFRRSDCPYLYSCENQVTRDYFMRICNTPGYVNCQHFAKMVGELRRPMTWLQKLAVEQERLMESDVEVR